MFDINRHKYFLVQILREIYSDTELSLLLGFKGGTALLLFYDLPRFSVDLDFNLIDPSKGKFVYEKVKKILLKYGKIRDEAKKHYGIILVLDYGENERNMKVEISERDFGDSYEVKNFLGINMKVMTMADMFAHKLCALTDRNVLANRDIFDVHFFLEKRISANKKIIESRMNTGILEYLGQCIAVLKSHSDLKILDGLGELIDSSSKSFVKNKLLKETIILLQTYRNMPF
ncbi:MAG: nucleotidyl transferase AbiEii/AbiGii toxin family protein [Bacteroidota bacterium]